MNVVKNDGSKFGGKFPNGTVNGALGNIQKKTVDIALSTFFIKDYEVGFRSDFSSSLYNDELCVVVRKAARVPPQMLPLVIFDLELWIVLGIVTAIIYFVWVVLRYANNLISSKIKNQRKEFFKIQYNMPSHLIRKSVNRQYFQLFVDTWILIFSAPLQRFPKINNERVFLASVCLMSMVVTSMYQSGLATVFFKPMYYKDVTSLAALDKSDRKIFVKYVGYMDDTFPENTSKTYDNLRKKMILIKDLNYDVMTDIAHVHDVATVTRKSTRELGNSEFFLYKKLYMIEECPKKYNLAYVLPYHSIFLERINCFLLFIKNAGLVNKWIGNAIYAEKLKTIYGYRHQANFKVLTIWDLQMPFFLLAFGILMSTLLLTIENFVNFLIKPRKMQ